MFNDVFGYPHAELPREGGKLSASEPHIGRIGSNVFWEVPQPGPAKAKTWSGVLATAGGLCYGQPNRGFAAVDESRRKDFVAISNHRVHESFSNDVHGGVASSTWLLRLAKTFCASDCEPVVRIARAADAKGGLPSGPPRLRLLRVDLVQV
jgi:hypothetical protein